MTDARLHELRRQLRAGRLEPDLVGELQSVVRRLVRSRTLPPDAVPYGQWDDEAGQELFAAWYADRLLARGHLQMMLDRARTVGAFRRLAERSLRQHLSNRRDRSQAQNLYHRLIALLEEDDDFGAKHGAQRAQERWWGLAGSDARSFSGSDRELLAAAWALGDFAVLRYRADAKKLSPVLDSDELKRFVAGLLARVGSALTPAHIMRALAARFDLGQVEYAELDEAVERGRNDVAAAVIMEDTARSVVAELSQRQAEVLRRTSEQNIDEIADALGCSVGTVVNEQRRIGGLVSRASADDEERDGLLRMTVDLLYLGDDE